jgi:hypothetical protein
MTRLGGLADGRFDHALFVVIAVVASSCSFTRGDRPMHTRPRRTPIKTCITTLALFVLCFGVWSPASQAQEVIEVFCFDNVGQCFEELHPNPIVIPPGGSVQWLFDPSCGIGPCSGRCQINVPPGPGFNGFNDVVNVPGFSNQTPPFNQPGVFYYQLECSPAVIGTIIVGNPGLQLFIQGSCPGNVTLSATQATAGAKVFFAYGFASGSTNVPGCPGVSADINKARLAGSRTADGTGEAKLTGKAPAGLCGTIHVQAVEIASCRKSGVGNL